MLKGWRTIGVNALALALAAANQFGVSVPPLDGLIAHASPAVLALGLPIVNVALRTITTTRVGKAQ